MTGDRKGESNVSPETPDRGETSDIFGRAGGGRWGRGGGGSNPGRVARKLVLQNIGYNV